MDDMTLDPPGTIAVVGAGPLGIEAALYGRFLGYDVTLIEAVQVANSLRDRMEQPLSISPDRCLSPLAVGALQSQHPEFVASAMPMKIGELVDQALLPLTETDLLRGRLKCPGRVTEIQTLDVDVQEAEDPEVVPPDFRLTLSTDASNESFDAEAVILATGEDSGIELAFPIPTPYFFQIEGSRSGNPEQDFWKGLKQIVSVFAELAGREDLDLYRPRRN